MNLARLLTLKEKLVNAVEFKPVLNYFLDHFGEHPDFLDLGRKVEDPLLECLIEAAGESLFSRPVKLQDLILVQIPIHRFVHGAFTLGGLPANVIYFQDIRQGMLSVMGKGPDGMVHFVRFCGEVMAVGPRSRDTAGPSEDPRAPVNRLPRDW